MKYVEGLEQFSVRSRMVLALICGVFTVGRCGLSGASRTRLRTIYRVSPLFLYRLVTVISVSHFCH